jgi:hypothetical protein
VTGYFQEKGISRGQMILNPSRDFLSLSLSISQAEEIFQVRIINDISILKKSKWIIFAIFWAGVHWGTTSREVSGGDFLFFVFQTNIKISF